MQTETHWWAYGNYTGDACPNCQRERLMKCEDDEKHERVICEKCSWEPAKNDYCYDALGN
jgi:hypothetical protein